MPLTDEIPDSMLHAHEQKIYKLEIRVEALERDNTMLKDQLGIYQASSVAMSHKMDTLLVAFVGDEKMKITGLSQRIESIEVVTNMVKELKWKFAGALIVVGWAMAVAYWVLEKAFK